MKTWKNRSQVSIHKMHYFEQLGCEFIEWLTAGIMASNAESYGLTGSISTDREPNNHCIEREQIKVKKYYSTYNINDVLFVRSESQQTIKNG